MPVRALVLPVFRPLRWVACAVAICGLHRGSAAASPSDELGRPVVRNYPPGEHLKGTTSQTMAQDAAGSIVFGNGVGILVYDSATWSYYDLPTEAAGVRQFARGPDGNLYLGGASVLGYLRGTGRDLTFVSLADQLPPASRNIDEIRYAAAIGDAVCFSDDEKVLLWRDGRFTVIPYPTTAHSLGARLHAVGETLFVTALGHPLTRLAGDRLDIVADAPVLSENQIVAIAAGAAPGTLVLLTATRGFFQIQPDGQVAPLPVEANRWLAGRQIFRALRAPDGSWAVTFSATSGDGGMRFTADGRYQGPLDPSIGIHLRALRDLNRDREGGLLIGMETGATRVEWPSAVTLFDVFNGLGQGAATDVARVNGVLYAATTEGIFHLLPLDATGRGAHFERVFSGPVHSLLAHSGDLLATARTQVVVSSPAGFIPVAPLPPGGGRLHRSTHDSARVWVATARGIQALHFTPEGWHDDGPVPGFTEDCRDLCEAPDGALWVATAEHGFFRLEFSSRSDPTARAPRVEHFAGGRGLPEKFARAGLAIWANEPVFVIDTAPQPFRFDATRRRFEPWAGTADLAPPSPEGPRVPSEEATGDRWLAGADAIYRLPSSDRAPQRLPHLALAAAGNASRLREETGPTGHVLWICGAKGLVRVEVADAFTTPAPLIAYFTAADVHDGDRLEPEPPPLTFRFVAPRHQRGNTVRYQSRLVGFDRDWSPWTEKRERYFPHLPAGSYRFEVRARDADDVTSAPATLHFTVLAPWWLTRWALLGYAALGAGFVAGIVRLRTHALHQRAERLEGVVAERTAELEQKNRELTRLHRLEFDEKVAARLAEEKSRLEVLRYQLNPHFLFNTLASISASLPVARGPAHAMVERLADFCRLTLHRADDGEWTTLGAEMRLLRAYLEIEQSRWADLLDVEIACDSALDDERLPYFLLLPLVENALKYGRATSPDRVGIRLAVARDVPRRGLRIEVANTGEWVKPSARKAVSSLGIGLDNLRERLARYYPRTHELVFSHADGWVTVVLHLFAPPPVV